MISMPWYMKWLCKLSVGKRFAWGFTLIIFLMGAVIAIGLSNMSVIRDNADALINDSLDHINHANKMRDAVRSQAISLRDIALQQDLSFMRTELKLAKAARERYQEAAEALKPAIVDEEGKFILAEIDKLENAVAEKSSEVVNFALSDDYQRASDEIRDKVRPEQMKLLEQLDNLISHLEKQGHILSGQSEAAYERSSVLMTSIGLLSIVLGIITAYIMTKSIVFPLTEATRVVNKISGGDLTGKITLYGSDETSLLLKSFGDMGSNLRHIITGVSGTADTVATSSTQLLSLANDAAKQAIVQNERIVSVSVAAEQMSASIAEIAQSAHAVLDASVETHSSAESSTRNISKILESTDRVVESVKVSNAAITELRGDILKITEITGVIKEIADQTNLLALNAAIESARAGEQGRGFAVVAQEVRELASRTAQSTASITKMIETVKGKSDYAVDLMGKVMREVETGATNNAAIGDVLEKISHSASQATKMVESIVEATREQATASDDIAKNMGVVSSISDDTANNLSQVQSAAGQMKMAAQDMRKLISQFSVGESLNKTV